MNHESGLDRFIRTQIDKFHVECAYLLGASLADWNEQEQILSRIRLLAETIRFAEKCKEGEPKSATKTIEGFTSKEYAIKALSSGTALTVTRGPQLPTEIPATLTFQLPEAEKFLRKIND